MELKISTPKTFSFRRTVASHGWYGLLPFSLDSKKWELTRVIDVGPKPPVTIAHDWAKIPCSIEHVSPAYKSGSHHRAARRQAHPQAR